MKSLILTVLAAASIVAAQACPENFVSVGSTCLYIQPRSTGYDPPRPMTWSWLMARDICTNMTDTQYSVDLVSNFDGSQLHLMNQFIYNSEAELGVRPYWVGMEATEGEWRWLDGSQVNPKSYIWEISSPYTSVPDGYHGLLINNYPRLYVTESNSMDTPSFICEARTKG